MSTRIVYRHEADRHWDDVVALLKKGVEVTILFEDTSELVLIDPDTPKPDLRSPNEKRVAALEALLTANGIALP